MIESHKLWDFLEREDMGKIVFECETITPMFMYGADGTTPELRPASIKGVMRFWWRAIHGNLSLDELKRQEGEIFGSTDKRSSFSIKIRHHKFQENDIPEKFKFKIEFLLSNRCNFDVKSFFELVVVFGLFGQKEKNKKDGGKIKILKIDNINYTQTIDLDYIYTFIEKFSSNYSKKKFKIEQQEIKEKYPLVKDISISRDNKLYVNFIHSTKLKAIKKNLKNYNG